MKIRLEFEIPNWTRWIAVGLVVGLGAGYGIATVRATSASTRTVWSKGDVLTAAALNQNFQDLWDASNAQQLALGATLSPDCPSGYQHDTASTSIVLCKKGFDEVVRVGTGGAVFWIDRYEASIWSVADGTGTQFGLLSASDFPATFPPNGQYASPVFALSAFGVTPSRYVTWFRADAACESSGKRLPTSGEWLRAARGTVDPGDNDGSGGNCLTSGSQVRATGLGTGCVSKWGTQDMIGNLWEWTADWYAAPGNAANHWPSDYNNDSSTSLAVAQNTDGNPIQLPTAVFRGGSFADGTEAGVYAMSLFFSPVSSDMRLGFRCVMGR